MQEKNVRIGTEGEKRWNRYISLKKKKGWPRKATPLGAEHQINFFPAQLQQHQGNKINSNEKNVNPARRAGSKNVIMARIGF
jgi:negative regulator of sigma E activity